MSKINRKVVRFLICGLITAIFNILLLILIIKSFNIETASQRNVANLFAIEVSLLFSFFVYRTWVWSVAHSTIKEILFHQLPLYHLSVAISTGSRGFIIFPILDWLGINYIVNTLIGIILGSIINYKISDKWVFQTKAK